RRRGPGRQGQEGRSDRQWRRRTAVSLVASDVGARVMNGFRAGFDDRSHALLHRPVLVAVIRVIARHLTLARPATTADRWGELALGLPAGSRTDHATGWVGTRACAGRGSSGFHTLERCTTDHSAGRQRLADAWHRVLGGGHV